VHLSTGLCIVSTYSTYARKKDTRLGVFFIYLEYGIRTIKCSADERCRRGLDRADPLFSPKAKMQTSPIIHPRKKDTRLGVFFYIRFQRASSGVDLPHDICRGARRKEKSAMARFLQIKLSLCPVIL
jgi:hypothetical protein